MWSINCCTDYKQHVEQFAPSVAWYTSKRQYNVPALPTRYLLRRFGHFGRYRGICAVAGKGKLGRWTQNGTFERILLMLAKDMEERGKLKTGRVLSSTARTLRPKKGSQASTQRNPACLYWSVMLETRVKSGASRPRRTSTSRPWLGRSLAIAVIVAVLFELANLGMNVL